MCGLSGFDAETKLIASWMIGPRDAQSAYLFMQDLSGRLANRVQLTTDGHAGYLNAVDAVFGTDIDYAMLIKICGAPEAEEARYSPAQCMGTRTEITSGNPDKKKIGTSYIERQNLTMRMHMRRFKLPTSGFSKKIENHIAAISLHFMYYNFVRIHQTLRVTPAIAAGVTDRLMSLHDVVVILEQWEAEREKEKAAKRDWHGPMS